MGPTRLDLRTPRHVVENTPRMNPNPPAKPWVVRTIKRNRASVYHPWFIELDNHYYMPGANGFKSELCSSLTLRLMVAAACLCAWTACAMPADGRHPEPLPNAIEGESRILPAPLAEAGTSRIIRSERFRSHDIAGWRRKTQRDK